jgi:hypothetical protein
VYGRLSKMHFNRYVYGKPNMVNIPINFGGIQNNIYIWNYKCKYDHNQTYVKVWTYDDKFPLVFEINVAQREPGKHNTISVKSFEEEFLPDNLYLHNDMRKIYSAIIWKMYHNDNSMMLTNKYVDDGSDEEEIVIAEKDLEEAEKINNRKRKFPKIPLLKASGKVLAQTKEKAGTREAIEEILNQRRENFVKKADAQKEKRMKKASGEWDSDDD